MTLQNIAHYRVHRLLGVGGMGEVYLAEDSTLHRKVALKLLPERFRDDEERVRRFQREARAASALNHPNIITVYEIGEADSRHYIATELVDGSTLRDRISRQEPISVVELLDIAIGAASALAAAHDAGIIHRDIKPENIMVRRDGYVKVLDFGLAKLVSDPLAHVNTTTGTVFGTLLYLAPEQAQGVPPDHRADIYSLGAVMYEMLTRRPPVMADTLIDLAMAIVMRDPPAPSTIAAGVPPELDRIVMKALAKDRDRRYAHARDLLHDLTTLRKELEFESKLSLYETPTLSHRRTDIMTFPARTTSNVFARLGTQVRRRSVAISFLALLLVAAGVVMSRGVLVRKPSLDSVAVLPFVNASGDPDSEYLSDGIAESIIDSLSQLPELRVVARSSSFRYKGRQVDPLAVARELGVRGVVTGQVAQRGDTLVIRAALVDAHEGTQVWGQQYNRKLADVLAVQQEMAHEMSSQLRTRLSGEEKKLLARHQAENSESFQLYLKGRYHRNKYNEESIRRAIAYYHEAIDSDPTYALAYAGLADAYYGLSNLYVAPREAMPRAREAAKRALALDESLAEAHTSLALVLVWFDWQFREGEQAFRRALALKPDDAEAHRLYGNYLTAIGAFDRALEEKRRAARLDPLSVPATWDVARTLYFAGRLAEADREAVRTLEMDDRFAQAIMLRAQIASDSGRTNEALQLIGQALNINRTPLYIASWGYINARAGNRAEALQAMEELRKRPTYTLPLFMARVNAGLGDHDEAMRWLEQAYADRSESVVWLKVDPSFRTLHDDPRFAALIRRVGLVK